jgi:hypothetical protein
LISNGKIALENLGIFKVYTKEEVPHMKMSIECSKKKVHLKLVNIII